MTKIRNIIKEDLSFTILVGVFICIQIFLITTLGGKLYSGRNFSSMAFQISEFAVLALGMGLTIILAGIDLSLIANANLSGIIAGYIMTGKVFDISSMGEGTVIIISVIVALVLSALMGLINGLLISNFSVTPLIATLGTMTLYGGIGMAITTGKGVVGFPEGFLYFGAGDIGGIPYIFILAVALAIMFAFFLKKTSVGRKIYIIGENHTASRFSAINNEKIIRIAYTIAGLMAGIASIMIISRVNSAKVGYGDTYLLQAVLVCILGGISPSGGKGRVEGVMLSVLAIQFLQSAFNQWQFSPYSKKLIWGFMLLGIMLVNKFLEKYTVSMIKKRQAAEKNSAENISANSICR